MATKMLDETPIQNSFDPQRKNDHQKIKDLVDILECMSDSFLSVDQNWILRMGNSGLDRISGRNRQDDIGKNFLDIYFSTPELKNTELYKAYQKCMVERISMSLEDYYAPLKIWIEVRIFPIPNSGLAVFFSDITEKRKTKAKLQESSERLKLATETARIGTFNFNIETEKFKLSEISRQILDLPPQEAYTPQEISLSCHPDDRSLVESETRRLLDLNSSRYMARDFKILRQDGQLRYVYTTAQSLVEETSSGTQVVSIIGTHLDVTDRVQLLQDLALAKKIAEQANESKSTFLAHMSHEIRTPLGAIAGFVELLKVNDLSSEQVLKYLEIVERNSKHLIRIVDDILDLSKVEAGKMLIENVEFSLVDFLADFQSFVVLRAKENHNNLIFDVEGFLPEALISDPTRIRQILNNLVGNAIKFTENGQIKISLSFKNSTLCFTVQDSGRGISEEQQKKIFQTFSQADSSTTRKFGGTGLGLVLAKKLSQALGGDCQLVQSELDKGSIFKSEIKVQVPSHTRFVNLDPSHLVVKASTPSGVPLDTHLGLNILIVEDSCDIQMLIRLMLNKTGSQVTFAQDGIEGVDQALKSKFDVILMDIQMPKMDGHQATRILRTKGIQTPIVALTAHAMKEEYIKTQESGFSYFLSKPLYRHELLNLLRLIKLSDNVIA